MKGPARAQHVTEACENSKDTRRSVFGRLASENLLTIDVSHLIADLDALNQSLEAELQDSLHAFSPEPNASRSTNHHD